VAAERHAVPLAVTAGGSSKAHIPARPAKGIITSYRGASLIQVRLRAEVTTEKAKSVPRGDIVEFTAASRRRMLELLAKVEQKAVPLFLTLTYPDNFPPYREDYKGHLEAFCDRIQRHWPTAAIIRKLEFKARKSGNNNGKIAPHYHLFVFGVPWRFRFKEERGQSVSLRRVSVRAELPDGGEFPNGQVYGADSLMAWVSRNWFGVVGSGDFAHYKAGPRAERLKTIKGAFAYAGKRYIAKMEEMPVMEQKPRRYWGVIGPKHLPLGKPEDLEVTPSQAVKLRRVMRRYRLASTPPEKRKFLRKSQLWPQDFTAKLFCNVEFWLERLPKLIGICQTAPIAIPNSEIGPGTDMVLCQ
jgi:hypothetical protein